MWQIAEDSIPGLTLISKEVSRTRLEREVAPWVKYLWCKSEEESSNLVV